MITRVKSTDLTKEQWNEQRRKAIGGSDAGAVLGLNPYKSPYALWAEKTGKVIPEDISDKEAVRLGNDLEDYVAQRWMEATGKKLRKDNYFVYNSEYPFAHVQADRLVVGEKAGFEAKTTSDWEIVKQCREGKYPATWYSQCVHGMLVTGLERWYLGVLCLGKGFYHFTIERNEDEIKALAAAEESFWFKVLKKIPPALDGTESTQESLKTVLGDSTSCDMDLTGCVGHLQLYTRLKEQAAQINEQINECQAHIMHYMGVADRGSYGDIKVSFKTQTRKTFDRKAYEAVHGTIPDQFFKTSKSRPFKVTVNK